MKFKSLIFTTLVVILGMSAAQAQQDAEYSMYMFNGLYLNPAYAGSKEAPTVMAIYRHQWTGIEGAPRSFNTSAHSTFKNKMYALGGTLHYDQLGDERKYKFDVDFAFRIPVKNEDNTIALGVRAGLLHYNMSPQNYQPDFGNGFDPILEETVRSFIPNFGFGIHAQGKRYYAGVGLPHLLNMNLKKSGNLAFGEDNAKQFKHVFVTGGVMLGKEYGKVKVKPSFLYKWSEQSPMDFDFNLSFLFIDRIWAGASYRIGGDDDNRSGESIIGILKFKATQQLEIGYAYDHTLSRLGPFNSGTHEIMIGLEFGEKGKQFVTPRYINYF